MGAYYLPKRKSPPLVLAGAVFSGLVHSGSNFQGAYRDKFTNLSLNLDQIDLREARGSVLPFFLGGDQALQADAISSGIEFNCVMSVVELVPDQVPYNYGYGYLELFTRWIPRAIWPDKIYPQMEAVQGVLREAQLSGANVRDSDILMGPAFTFVGHWFYVAGPIGLILGGLLTGVLFRTIRTIYDRGNRSEGDILIYVSLIGIGFSEAASTPLAWLSTLPFVLGPLALILFLCRASIRKMETAESVVVAGKRERGSSQSFELITPQFIASIGRIPWLGRATRWYASQYPENSVIKIRHGHAAGFFWRRHHRYVHGYWIGHYELPIQEALKRELKPGHTFFDLGAHAGFFTLVAAQLVGTNGYCVAFEPAPENCASIHEQIELNSLCPCLVVNEAISDRVGSTFFSFSFAGSCQCPSRRIEK